ncbi:mitofilin family membrane protein [Niveispirillum sp. BGYR6]|uniref:COG4223 family protein n=1 Tax=Niveispirillum sp. BGYR6 TaxID=2971249 RepID=UPI0022B976EB|nr:mitofilin family membrane protein [Niveispirillum sp. BGYR6]MDG5497861.1 mitofilin family membrane protein [Niveispirillum sp. BGYR6]
MADEMNREAPVAGSPAEKARALATDSIIERFGGIRPMAGKLGLPAEDVQLWRKRGFIPLSVADDLAAAAAAHGITLTRGEIDAASAPEQSPTEAERRRLAELEREVTDTRNDKAERPAPAPSAKPAPNLAPPPRRRGGRLLGGTALLLALAALSVAGYSHWQQQQMAVTASAPVPTVDVTPLEAQIAALRADAQSDRTQVAALAKRLDNVEAQVRQLAAAPATAAPAPLADTPAPTQPPAAPSDLEPQLSPLRDQVTALGQRVDGLEKLTALLPGLHDGHSSLRQKQDELGGRVDALEARKQQASAGEGLVVAIGQLQAALVAGRPYAKELRAVQALTRDLPDLAATLAPLSASAESGLASDVALNRQFRDLAPAILAADRTRSDASWTDQALGRLSSIITIRRASGEVAGDGADAILARAEAALNEGSIAKAVAEMEKLSGPAAEKAAPWLAPARARVAAEAAAQALADLALARLSGHEGTNGEGRP